MMEVVNIDPQQATIRLTRDGITLLVSAIGESIEALEDWEFNTRTGFEKDEFHNLQKDLNSLLTRMEKGES